MSDFPMGGMFGDLVNMLGQQGPDAWFVNANQLALNVARGEDGDPNPLPSERQRLEELAPLIGRHVDAIFELVGHYEVTAVNRTGLTVRALQDWKPLLEPLTSAPPTIDLPGGEGNPLMAQLASTLGPMFLGFQLGSVAGHFAERAWSLAALPLPRTGSEHLLVVNNLVTFADEWSLARDVVYTFALAREFVAGVVLSQSGTNDALRAVLLDGVNEAARAQGDIMSKLQGMMDPESMRALMEHPESLLEGITAADESPATRALNAAIATLAAFFDYAAFYVTESLRGPQIALREAWKRYRHSDARGEDAAAALFGVTLQGPHNDAADSFVAVLSAAHGIGVFDALLRVDGLPSVSELDAPFQWFERVTHSPLA